MGRDSGGAPPPKLRLPLQVPRPCRFLGPTWSPRPKRRLKQFNRLAQLTVVINRETTDTQTDATSVAIGRICGTYALRAGDAT